MSFFQSDKKEVIKAMTIDTTRVRFSSQFLMNMFFFRPAWNNEENVSRKDFKLQIKLISVFGQLCLFSVFCPPKLNTSSSNDVYMLILNVKFCANWEPTKHEPFRKVSYLANVRCSIWKFPILIVQSGNSTSTHEYFRILTSTQLVVGVDMSNWLVCFVDRIFSMFSTWVQIQHLQSWA